ncbi:MAG TPA: hypothetical protein VF177_01505 [Anaerolineae bacterium]
MDKPAEVELAQLKEALTYPVGLLQEGSLMERYHDETRDEIADVLWHLMAMEYQATCAGCGGFVYVSHSSTYDLLLDDCERI